MRKLRYLRLSLVEGCLDTLRLTWEDARRRQLEQSSTDKLLSDFLQSPSDYTAVGLVTPRTRAGHPPPPTVCLTSHWEPRRPGFTDVPEISEQRRSLPRQLPAARKGPSDWLMGSGSSWGRCPFPRRVL